MDAKQLTTLFSLIDLTSLNDADDGQTIAKLCKKAILPGAHVAAICVYPRFVPQVVQALQGGVVKIATVVNFPSGNDSLENVVKAIAKAIAEGANEIDVVFPYTRFLAGEKAYAEEFIRACKGAAGDCLLKVILETGALSDLGTITEISELAIAAGADFLKTSTGKISMGATLEAAEVMLLAIQSKAKSAVGLKVSGGIRTIEQASQYIELVKKTMGTAWITPAHFRIGASQLADNIIKEWAPKQNA